MLDKFVKKSVKKFKQKFFKFDLHFVKLELY